MGCASLKRTERFRYTSGIFHRSCSFSRRVRIRTPAIAAI
jgi:hypothetical protein